MTVTPPLTEDDAAALRCIAVTHRQEDVTPGYPDPSTPTENLQRRFREQLKWHYLILDPDDDDLSKLAPVDMESGMDRDDTLAVLQWLVEHFFKPRGYVLEGEFTWSGSDAGGEDRGIFYVKDNNVEAVWDVIDNPGPSWNKPENSVPEGAKLSPAAYVERGGIVCPCCESYDISGKNLDVEGSAAWQQIDCHACGGSWVDEFRLVGYSNLELPEVPDAKQD